MRNVVWGDMHRQTQWTCGEGTPDQHFQTAKDHFKMDFAAVTDNARLEDPRERLFPGEKLLEHRHFLPGREAHSISEEQWQEVQAAVRRHSRDEDFVALLGYEWCSARWGDHNVYYGADHGALHLPDNIRELYAGPESGGERLIIPHHPGYARGRRGVDWNVHDPYQERLVEIYSTQHGCSEHLGSCLYPLYSRSMGGITAGSSVLDALRRGHKLGFTAGSDSHWLLQKSGLTGVRTEALTRSGIFQGLWNRQTIATTGPKYAAWFFVGPFEPGSIAAIDYLPVIRIELPGGEWEEVELIRNGEVIAHWNRDDSGFLQVLTYQETSSGLLPDNFYYVRITLPHQEQAWISPVWVSYLPEAEFARDTLYWLPALDVHFWGRHGPGAVRLNLRSHDRADGTIDVRGFQILDKDRNLLNEVGFEGGRGAASLAPGQGLEECLNSGDSPAAAFFRARFSDRWHNVYTVERTRILGRSEETTFPLEHCDPLSPGSP